MASNSTAQQRHSAFALKPSPDFQSSFRSRSHSRPRSMRPIPRPIAFPPSSGFYQDEDKDDRTDEEAGSLVGLSMGPEQTRLASPTTPAAERSAAFDRTHRWGFFDDIAEGDHEDGHVDDDGHLKGAFEPKVVDEDRTTAQAGDKTPKVTTSTNDAAAPELQLDETQAKNGSIVTPPITKEPQPTGTNSQLPSPWTAGPKQWQLENESKAPKRPRSQFVTRTLAELSFSRFRHSNRNAESVAASGETTPRPASPVKKAPSTDGEEHHKKRSSSVFTPRLPWRTHNRREGSVPPVPKIDTEIPHVAQFAPRPAVFATRPSPEQIQQSILVNGTGTSNENLAVRPVPVKQKSSESTITFAEVREHKQQRKTVSRNNTEFSLGRSSTVYSFEGEIDFENNKDRVNGHFKVIRDSFQDVHIKMPRPLRVPSLRRGPRKGRAATDLGDGREGRAMETVFRNDSEIVRTRSLTPSGRGSPKHSHHPMLDELLEDITGDVVIMGGYRGSILKSVENPSHQLWVPFRAALNLQRVDLEVPFDEEGEERELERVFASEMLSHVGPIDVSRRLIRKFQSCDNAREGRLRFHDWGYDWRLSPERIGRQLIDFLSTLQCNQPDTPVAERGATVIAHSLGGVITRWTVNQRPELFAGVLYAGAPQHTVNILGPLRNGDDVLLSSRVLTAQVNFSIRTSFVFLPESGRCFIDKETKEEYPVDFYDPQTWEDCHLSPCINPPLAPLKARRNSLLDTISNAVPTLTSKSSVSSLRQANLSQSSQINQVSIDNQSNNTTSTSTATAPEPHMNQSAELLTQAAEKVERIAENLAHPVGSVMNPSIEPVQPPTPVTSISSSNLTTTSTTPHVPSATVTFTGPEAREYLERTLASTVAFRTALHHKRVHEYTNVYPPLAVLYAANTPTVYGAKVSGGREGIKRSDAYDNLAFAEGDGVVLARAAMLPKRYRYCEGGRVRTDRGHVGLLGDLESVAKCLLAVRRARLEEGVGLGLGVEGKEGRGKKGEVERRDGEVKFGGGHAATAAGSASENMNGTSGMKVGDMTQDEEGESGDIENGNTRGRTMGNRGRVDSGGSSGSQFLHPSDALKEKGMKDLGIDIM